MTFASASILAAKAGKDVYSEKPCGLTIGQCQSLAYTMHRTARVFQAGTQRRNVPNFQFAAHLARWQPALASADPSAQIAATRGQSVSVISLSAVPAAIESEHRLRADADPALAPALQPVELAPRVLQFAEHPPAAAQEDLAKEKGR